MIDSTALHRNEHTQEIEGFEDNSFGPVPLLGNNASTKSMETTKQEDIMSSIDSRINMNV
jgi:hypothetical protein